MIEIEEKEEVKFELLFEDGPFWIEGIKSKQVVTLYFLTAKKLEEKRAPVQSSYDEIVGAVLNFGLNLKRYLIMEKRWHDVKIVKDWCTKLKALKVSLK